MVTHTGGCHCGAVKFEVQAPTEIDAIRCNCSICSMTGFVHLIVPKEDFKLLTSPENITTYRFNTKTAKHSFCKSCGIKSFYTPRSHPNGISVNVNCMDLSTFTNVTYSDFDGENWEDNIDQISDE